MTPSLVDLSQGHKNQTTFYVGRQCGSTVAGRKCATGSCYSPASSIMAGVTRFQLKILHMSSDGSDNDWLLLIFNLVDFPLPVGNSINQC